MTNNKYLLAILCSAFIGWYFKKRFQISNSDTFPQILARDILNFPIPEPSKEEQSEINLLVDKIMAAKKDNPDADTADWEREIDERVYRLYGLTKDEIAIVERNG
jgi:type II restriction/modification system DNA methylase subunit YeeA